MVWFVGGHCSGVSYVYLVPTQRQPPASLRCLSDFVLHAVLVFLPLNIVPFTCIMHLVNCIEHL
ncbi:hypothetical protein B0H12DRAFT_1114476 [Mycena haematopus]|nr:hypothetical protein B0H12DRAFT_1114476 [Mycena haematopus]